MREFTLEEVSKHSKVGDLWLLFGTRVFDVSSFNDHPGSIEALLENSSGKDAQSAFDKKGHSSDAKAYVETFFIGNLKKE